jgi:hypothetical protein
VLPPEREAMTNSPAEVLRRDLEHLRRLKRLISDPRAIEAIEQTVAEKEAQLFCPWASEADSG